MKSAIARAKDPKPDKPATHIVYTPMWEPEYEGGQFYKWVPVGSAWRGDDNSFGFYMDREPTNRKETATNSYLCVPVDALPPAPLKVTRDEYLEQLYVERLAGQ